ncbi:pyridoxamine 5'-phosphate oxidase family protein [Kocuria sp. JC486]|uniref:Pyridoxamine 5'-phosphate oxidase family protein n=2 Tax=Micrococcaceae TaxID=1268 RepID=A0A3N4A8B3_9MICC|nr:pyridoxamine 5'-phosphate oxidase family protein [Kocuria sp. JC486]ROZ65795.1 pyridoxamine 5'-phosphate oxidase family protein [Kocuria soli]
MNPAPLPEDQDAHQQERASEALTEDQCWEYLEAARFGRLATMDDEDIEITPINFVADGRKLYFRTARGAKLFRLTLTGKVALEIDRVAGDSAWSVLARGSARQLTDNEELEHARSLDLKPWLDTEKIEFVEIVPTRVTGRSFRLG